MYCNVVVRVSYEDEECNIVITEANQIPEERRFEVVAGYVVESGYDFEDVYNSNFVEVQLAIKKWLEEDEFNNTRWEDFIE